MSAGVRPEGFGEYMDTIRDASVTVIQSLGEYEQKVVVPALIMALVSACRSIADEEEAPSFEVMVSLIHEGIDSLANDFLKGDIDNGH
jgi:hypothetical protein